MGPLTCKNPESVNLPNLPLYANIHAMSKVCAITQKSSVNGGGYSNRTRATQFNPTGKRRRYANIQKKKIFVPELGMSVTLNVSTRAIKTIQKNGAFATLKKAGLLS